MDRFFDYGIDLGTTNSCVARTTLSDVVIFQNLDNMNVTPSAVHIDKRGRMFIGRKAHDKLISEPENTAVEFKRFMGIEHTDKFASTGRKMTPVELSAEILKSLREDVLRQTGSPLSNAIITVPASFDTRQCDATTKAGKLAGLDNILLLQEPIAAAIAYGAKPDSKNQYWMVFDFGGGTLDIAIVSTHDNKLSVINHEGDNRLGGKNIDTIICDEIILPKLKEKYRLTENLVSLENIKRCLKGFAETTKKTLSTAEIATIDIYDIGQDMNGEFIELSITITKKEFNCVIAEIVERGIELAKKSLVECNISAKTLNKILLVGGTTLIPLIRQKLSEEFNVPLDTSIDPITVVARGAAIYGSTMKISEENIIHEEIIPKLSAKIEYPSITSAKTANIVGKIVNAKQLNIKEIRIDNVTGIWSSGWINLLDINKGIFDADINLQENFLNFFKIIARNSHGNTFDVSNNSFTIRHSNNALITSSPPIPHSICVEKIINGESNLEIMIKKGTQLPAKAIKRFISNKTLSPKSKEFITIKIWEGENKNLTSNEWIGNVYIRGEVLTRPIPEGFEIEVSITIDESRRIEVSAYVPHIDLVIQDKFMYNCEPLNLLEPIEAITRELPVLFKQLQNKNFLTSDGMCELSNLLRNLKRIEVELNLCKNLVGVNDDRVIDLIKDFNDLKGEILEFEKKQSVENSKGIELEELARIDKAVKLYGTTEDFNLLEKLKLEYISNENNIDAKKSAIDKMISLKTLVMLNNPEFLKLALIQLSAPHCAYANATEALEWKARGQYSLVTGDSQGLQNAVVGLLNLSVDFNVDLFNQRALPADLR